MVKGKRGAPPAGAKSAKRAKQAASVQMAAPVRAVPVRDSYFARLTGRVDAEIPSSCSVQEPSKATTTHPTDVPWTSADGLRHGTAYTAWRNERRKQGRRQVTGMLAHLDSILPSAFQSTPSPNGAGDRAVGITGRSLHDVLGDTVRYLARVKQDRLHKQHAVEPADVIRRGLQKAESVLCVEVEGGAGQDAFTISGMGLGAESFFKDSPWGDATGSSLAHFVKCEDLGTFHNLIRNALGKSDTPGQSHQPRPSGSSVRLMHFSQVESIPGREDQAGFPQVSCLAAPKSLPMAFSYDPLLDPLPPPDWESMSEASAWSTSSAASDDTGIDFDPFETATLGGFQSIKNENLGLKTTDPTAYTLGFCNLAPPAMNCAYLPCELQMSKIIMASPCLAAETSRPTQQGWKAVIVAPLDLRLASTDESCLVCGCGSCGFGCRRSALLSMSPPSQAVPRWKHSNSTLNLPNPPLNLPKCREESARIVPAGTGHYLGPFVFKNAAHVNVLTMAVPNF